MIWTGLSFTVIGHRDGRFLHLPGLFAFARRDMEPGSLLLFAGQAEDLSCEAGPTHPQWEEALRLGMDELHVHFPVPRRIDRLQLLARMVRHTQPLLNCLEEAHGPPAVQSPSRCGCGPDRAGAALRDRGAQRLSCLRPTRRVLSD